MAYRSLLSEYALLKQWNLPYIDLMEKYSLTELRTRRNYLSLSLLHKIIYEDCICIFPNAPLVHIPRATMYFTCSQSASTFVPPQLRTNLFQNSFLPHTISSWNSLPAHITTTPSTTSFKHYYYTLSWAHTLY